MPETVAAAIAAHRLAILARLSRDFSDLTLAEDAFQDACEAAVKHWPDAMPANPGGWLMTVARRKAIDHLRRAKRQALAGEGLSDTEDSERFDEETLDGEIADERLALIFTCCHPAIERQAAMALALKTISGLSTARIASAFLVSETTMAQRLVRAKTKIRRAHIPFRTPGADELPERLEAVLDVIYQMFNAGHRRLVSDRADGMMMMDEAVRLARWLVRLGQNGEGPTGLLALTLFIHARQPGRIGSDGQIVALDRQDRSLWDRAAIREARRLLDGLPRRGLRHYYVVEAEIAARHTEAVVAGDTDWAGIAALYGELYALRSNPVLLLNRAIALHQAGAHDVAASQLAEVHDLLTEYVPLHLACAMMAEAQGNRPLALAAYDRALALSTDEAERAFIAARRNGERHDAPDTPIPV